MCGHGNVMKRAVRYQMNRNEPTTGELIHIGALSYEAQEHYTYAALPWSLIEL